MTYKEFQGLKLSALGLGAMRLPVIDGNDGMIDEGRAAQQLEYPDLGHGDPAGRTAGQTV